MRYISIVLLLAVTICFCLWKQMDGDNQYLSADDRRALRNTGIKWHDSLLRNLPANIDTNIIVVDLHGVPLHFYQYIKPVFDHEAMIYHDRGSWKLHRFTRSAQDSLSRDNYATAKAARFLAFGQADTISNCIVKLNAIGNTLAQADYVLVLKAKRLMLIKRKGLIVKTLKIDLGFSPVGKKTANKDGKTPEGIYNLDGKYVRGDKFYKSIRISYPNRKESTLAKSKGIDPGFGIAIHGTPTAKVSAKDWTAGCIALQNKDMDTLFKYIPEGVLIEIKN